MAHKTKTRADAFVVPDFSDIKVVRATSRQDYRNVSSLRASGFGRVLSAEQRASQTWVDTTDKDAETIVLLAFHDDEPVATMRVSSGKNTDTDLAKYVPLAGFLEAKEQPYIQFARLTAPKHARARDAMFALFKAAWMLAEKTGHNSIVCASPPWAIRTYHLMQFRDVGIEGEFIHPFGRWAKHKTLVLPIYDLRGFWRGASNPLSELFFDIHHLNLTIEAEA